jgi:hypothetical protein
VVGSSEIELRADHETGRIEQSCVVASARPPGLAANALFQLEQELNKTLGFRNRPLHVAADDLDPLMLAALGFQESGLDQSVRNRVGAVDFMQVMPATAADLAIAITDIEETEPNTHAGSKYLRFVMDTYIHGPGVR